VPRFRLQAAIQGAQIANFLMQETNLARKWQVFSLTSGRPLLDWCLIGETPAYGSGASNVSRADKNPSKPNSEQRAWRPSMLGMLISGASFERRNEFCKNRELASVLTSRCVPSSLLGWLWKGDIFWRKQTVATGTQPEARNWKGLTDSNGRTYESFVICSRFHPNDDPRFPLLWLLGWKHRLQNS
jgi:hypothetical protein